MKKIVTLLAVCLFFLAGGAMAMDSMSHDHAKKEGSAEMDHSKMESMEQGDMDHGTMDHDSAQMEDMGKETVMVDGINAEFQVMELADMKMSDPKGHTHHVMVSFEKDGQKISDAYGKVKIIAPSGKEQISVLKNFGSGVYAANFTMDEKGKWGVICLFQAQDGQHIAKFWYDNGMM